MIEKIAVIILDRDNELEDFLTWIERNRSHINGISPNTGCGCCVDIYNLLVTSLAESLPCETGGTFEADRILVGEEKDKLLDEMLRLETRSSEGAPLR